MANVRYSGGGTSATLGTKTIDENGIYNASSDELDGYSQVTVEVPQPSGDLAMTLTENAVYDGVDVKDYASATITVDVPVPPEPQTQTKSITANITQQTVTPDTGYTLSSVIVNPQRHDLTFTPNSNTASNDMGQIHDYRYVDTSGMIEPSGTKSVTYDTNGSHTEDVSQYANISVEVDVPVSGDLGTKSIIANGTYRALDDNLDGYSEVEVNVPQNATLGIKSITVNGNYNAITDGYDGFSRVDVNVAGATLQTSKSVTATTSQQTVTPDVGYDGMEQVIVNPQVHTQTYTPADNTAANDMGVNNNYRYVDTSGMYTPASITPSNASPAALTSGTAVSPTANGYAIESYTEVAPSNVSPATLSKGSIYKIKTNGGKAIESYRSITNGSGWTNPQQIYDGEMIKVTGDGYAIQAFNTPTPSDSNPPNLSGYQLNYPTADGYLYSTVQPKVKQGSFSASNGQNVTITCGFQPTKIFVYTYESSTKYYTDTYDSNLDATYQFMGYKTSSSATASRFSINASNNGIISGVTSTGFTFRGWNTFSDLYYVAIG